MALVPAEMMALSKKILDQLDGTKPEDGVPALMFSLGRLAGRHGVKNKRAADFWGQHTSEMAKALFTMGFELERKTEPARATRG